MKIFNFKRPRQRYINNNTNIVKDYQKQLDKYLDFPENRTEVEEYLERYWLDKKDLNEFWLKIKNKIFNPSFEVLPDLLFNNEDYDIVILGGGLVFAKNDFELLRSCMEVTGDKVFIVLEDYDERNPPHKSGPPLRFKYPADISWETMMSGADISNQVFRRPVRNYFVLGDSGKWGKYAGNDYEWPLDIIGFDKQYSELFRSKFKNSSKDIRVLKEWLAHYGMKLPRID